MAEYDLISKRALLRHLDMAIDCKDCPRNVDRKTYHERCACSEVADLCNIITDFATFADVQPVKRGHWIETDYGMFYECSECGNVQEFERNFCYECGANMRGDTE